MALKILALLSLDATLNEHGYVTVEETNFVAHSNQDATSARRKLRDGYRQHFRKEALKLLQTEQETDRNAPFEMPRELNKRVDRFHQDAFNDDCRRLYDLVKDFGRGHQTDEALALLNRVLPRMYKAGVQEGVTRYAHWENGEQYVGTCGTSLREALDQIDAEPLE